MNKKNFIDFEILLNKILRMPYELKYFNVNRTLHLELRSHKFSPEEEMTICSYFKNLIINFGITDKSKPNEVKAFLEMNIKELSKFNEQNK